MCGRLVPGVVLAVLMAGSAVHAADAPVLIRKAPAPVADYHWTGIYIGGHIGAGVSYRDWTLIDGRISEAGDALLLGGQVGVNYQIGKWIIGAEGDASWGNLKNESLCPDVNNTCWTRENWLATVTGRVGYAYDPALFYLKGGAAFTHADYFKTAQTPSVLDERAGARRHGWAVGAGMEYALWRSWTLKLEYDYLEFASRSLALNNIATGAFAENLVLREKAHEVKLGLNYLFNTSNWAPGFPQKASEPEPKRVGWAAPLDA